MISHVSIQCADVEASARFFDAVLAPLGGRRVMAFDGAIGYGIPRSPRFGSGPGRRERASARPTSRSRRRTASRCGPSSRRHRRSGAEVLHGPRLWPEYHPSYYGAFVRDPDGNNIEAVCHTPE